MSRRALLAACLLAAGCGSAGRYVWVEQYEPPTDSAAAYLLQPGDVLQIRVFNQDGMSTRVKVRADGKVSLPFAGELQAAGERPLALAGRIETQLKEFLKNPVVSVAVEEAAPSQISVLGEVAHPGLYPLGSGRLVDMLAAAGGLTEFARRDGVFVLRAAAPEGRIRFRYQAVTRAEGRAGSFRLAPGDAVVVE